MVDADLDPSLVAAYVIHPVRNRLAQHLVEEIVRVDLDRLTPRPPHAARVLVVADQLLLLCIDADHRLVPTQIASHSSVDVLELGISVAMLGALADLRVALQVVMLFM